MVTSQPHSFTPFALATNVRVKLLRVPLDTVGG